MISVMCYYRSISVPLALKGPVYQKYMQTYCVQCTYLRTSEDHHVLFQGFLFITLPETNSSLVVSNRNLQVRAVSFREGKSSNVIQQKFLVFCVQQ